MKIQNLVFPKIGICTEEKLFFRREKGREREVVLDSVQNELNFASQSIISFDTYFNSLSVAKWKKYTTASSFYLNLWLCGSFEVVLTNSNQVNRRAFLKIVDKKIIRTESKQLFTLRYSLYEYNGLLSFELHALDNHSCFYGGFYSADVNEQKLYDVNLAINICTFKREPFVKRNIDILNEYIINNSDNEMNGHLRVYISDNGHSLPAEDLNTENIRIVPNKNVGGAGGFTRGLIEIMKHSMEYPATHALMMDDDIIIEPEALFRTYTLLRCRKEEYVDVFVGGAMLRLDDQFVQVESGASWNEGKLISNKHGANLTDLVTCISNEEEEYTEYNAWWYCCTPMSVVSSENLPLPIFIRGDDLEYGLRNMKSLILMNGICVWHEAFENKYSSFLQYYILRNLLYDNSLHFPEYKLTAFLKRLWMSVLREIVYYRYENIKLIFRGVNDFFRGVDFLKETDGEKLHKEIMAAGYKAVPVEQIKDGAYHAPAYYASLKQTESRARKAFRYATLNGYLLPAKRVKGKNVKVVSMGLCRPINFYREKKVLNYDPTSGKGFVTEKKYGKAIKAFFELLAMTVKCALLFSRAKKSFVERFHEIGNEQFWCEYLDI